MGSKRVLVTGCGGFVGPHVVEALARAGYEAWGADLKSEVDDALLERYVSCDLSDRSAVEQLLDRAAPDAMVHLAAQSSAGRSFGEPFLTLTRNVLPTLNLLDCVRTGGGGTRVLAVGSADVYGPVSEAQLPLKETLPAAPANPYALSKAIQEQCCVQYASLYGLDVVVTRSFNHTGRGQRDTFVLPSFAKQIAAVCLGSREPVVDVGDLDLRRDFSDVGDVAQAYVALLERGKKGEVYNVCSGTSYALRDLLGQLFEIAGVEADIRVDPGRVRPADIRDLRGDPSKIARHTGWRSKTPIARTLESLLDYWADVLRQSERASK